MLVLLLGFGREDGSDIFPRNVDGLSPKYKALYPRIENSS
jgi:hypothetical protein